MQGVEDATKETVDNATKSDAGVEVVEAQEDAVSGDAGGQLLKVTATEEPQGKVEDTKLQSVTGVAEVSLDKKNPGMVLVESDTAVIDVVISKGAEAGQDSKMQEDSVLTKINVAKTELHSAKKDEVIATEEPKKAEGTKVSKSTVVVAQVSTDKKDIQANDVEEAVYGEKHREDGQPRSSETSDKEASRNNETEKAEAGKHGKNKKVAESGDGKGGGDAGSSAVRVH